MTTTSLTLRYRRPGENLREASCVLAAARRLWDVSSHDCRSRAHLIRLVAKLLCTNRSLTRMRSNSLISQVLTLSRLGGRDAAGERG